MLVTLVIMPVLYATVRRQQVQPENS
jgi:hypothetical protein